MFANMSTAAGGAGGVALGAGVATAIAGAMDVVLVCPNDDAASTEVKSPKSSKSATGSGATGTRAFTGLLRVGELLIPPPERFFAARSSTRRLAASDGARVPRSDARRRCTPAITASSSSSSCPPPLFI